jgi:hypothetical protein
VATDAVAARDTCGDANASAVAGALPHAEAQTNTDADAHAGALERAQAKESVKQPAPTVSPTPDAPDAPSRPLSKTPAAPLFAEASA